jgi:hypothetical protein
LELLSDIEARHEVPEEPKKGNRHDGAEEEDGVVDEEVVGVGF